MHLIAQPQLFLCNVRIQFAEFCIRYRVLSQLVHLNCMQLWKIPYTSMGYVSQSLKAFSRARGRVRIQSTCPAMEAQLWHSTLFTNKYANTYYNMLLVRQGILTVKHMFSPLGQPQQRFFKSVAPFVETNL